VLDDPKWPSRLSRFHMVDCVHGEGEFLEGRWNFAERLLLYGRLCSILGDSRLRPLGASVIVDCFQDIPKEDLELLSEERTRLGTPLDVCFHSIVQWIINAVASVGGDQTVGVVFDQDNKDREANFSTFCERYMSSFYLGDLFTRYGFADSRKIVPLQGADLIAYGTLQLAQTAKYPPASEPYFPVIPALMKMLYRFAEQPSTSPYGTIFNLDDLVKLVAKVKRGETLPGKNLS
jgi:hypothetical protein